jgi:phosphopantetheine adenylyltransferase
MGVSSQSSPEVGLFPGTFDPFSLIHKAICMKSEIWGSTVYMALDEFSWSKKTQPGW